MALRLGNITFDCEDTQKVAGFWSTAIDRAVDEGGNEFFVSIGMNDAKQPRWFFIKVPEAKSSKNRMHVDLMADDQAAEVERLVGLGATHVADKDEWGHQWTVMADVEGNEFCVG